MASGFTVLEAAEGPGHPCKTFRQNKEPKRNSSPVLMIPIVIVGYVFAIRSEQACCAVM